MADIVFELKGEFFRRRYLLYVVELQHGRSRYYYVGQTGDTRVITARPVFRRLAAHLEDRKSTQNQVYQYIAHDILGYPKEEGTKVAFAEQTRTAVEEYLVATEVSMHVYYLEPFKPTISRREHVKRRRNTQRMESQVIDLFHRNRRRVMNKRKVASASLTDCPYPRVMTRVAEDFGLRSGA